MKVRTTRCWGIVTGGVLLPYTIRLTRRSAINDYCAKVNWDWGYLRKRGVSVVKVAASYWA
jgi:hypothetical protein